MTRPTTLIALLEVAFLSTAAASAAAAPRVELEVAVQKGFVSTELATWQQTLSAVGADVLRLGGGSNPGQQIDVEKVGAGGAMTYRVKGLLTARNELLLPAGRFRATDRAAIAKWVADVKAAGAPLLPGQKPPPFGLQPDQLETISRELTTVVDFDTLGAAPATVLYEISRRTGRSLVAEPAVAQQLQAAEKVPGELKGLSCGTVAAAVLRRDGLALIPRLRADGAVEYYVTRPTPDQEIWPVGWTPEKPLPELLPELFTLRNVAIDDFVVSELLQVVTDRLKLPMLFDEQALVLKKLDPSKVKIKIAETKLGYQGVIDRALYAAGMKHEVRVDDAGKPFLWVTAR